MKSYLNLGCGLRYDPSWTNINFASTGPGVIGHNLLAGIPTADKSADFVYHSHVLEHFTRTDGERFIRECFRVLKPGGVIRVAVPDLERIAREYLRTLEGRWAEDYDWMMLELYDQAVRTTEGGEMARYLASNPRNKEFILQRLGMEAEALFLPPPPAQPRPMTVGRIVTGIRRRLGRWLLGGEAKALALGNFRLGGEVHQWMYDRFSLGRLLERCGFVDAVQRNATESYLPSWSSFNLDTEAGGRIYKPDSLYMEARKPA